MLLWRQGGLRRLRLAWRSCELGKYTLRCDRRLPLRHWARAVTLGMRRLASVARPSRSGPEPCMRLLLVPSPVPGAASAGPYYAGPPGPARPIPGPGASTLLRGANLPCHFMMGAWSCARETLRQWPEVYDSCHTFLHVARVRKHTDIRELHAKHVQISHVRVFSDSRNVQKRATKSVPRATAWRPSWAARQSCQCPNALSASSAG